VITAHALWLEGTIVMNTEEKLDKAFEEPYNCTFIKVTSTEGKKKIR
jgi:hypothetical protein